MRNAYWDAVKGLAIVAVVMIHATGRAVSMPTDTFDYQFGMVLRQFINFAVPTFLATAGYFSTKSRVDHPAEFIVRRFQRILPAYVFWIHRLNCAVATH